jgi:hypothetical protein
MDDFDLRLESELRRVLDPITAAGVPPRCRRRTPGAQAVELKVVPETVAGPVKAV